jgi:YesN/AraC family two-component response regulator
MMRGGAGAKYRPRMSVRPAQTTDVDGEISIVVADDQALVRAGLSAILESQPGIIVCGEAADGGEAIEVVRKLDPDVVLMDIQMPGIAGL